MDAGFVDKKKNYFALAGVMFSGSILFNLVLTLILYNVIGPILALDFKNYVVLLGSSTIIHIISIFIPAILLSLYVRPNKLVLKISGTSWKNIMFSCLIGFCAIPLINTANYIALILIKSSTGHINMPSIPNAGSLLELIFGLIVIALYPAISEELFFRGVLQSALQSRYSVATTILFTAFLFALNHFSFQVFLGIFLLGLIFSRVANRTGSLLPAITVHFINNAVATVLGYYSTDTNSANSIPTVKTLFDIAINEPQTFIQGFISYVALISVSLILLIVFYRCLSPRSTLNIDQSPVNTKTPGIIWFVPGILIILILYFFEFISLLHS